MISKYLSYSYVVELMVDIGGQMITATPIEKHTNYAESLAVCSDKYEASVKSANIKYHYVSLKRTNQIDILYRFLKNNEKFKNYIIVINWVDI